ncbi:MAG TPA: hypothetical protein VLV78_21185 [Thermoanaerobaculia bacterium]|nr:hypothetical protein [Thermoanaerobaculia bacterium]
MREDQAVFVGIAAAAVIAIVVVVITSRRSSSIRQLLAALASAAGWSDLRTVFVAAAGVKGRWRSYPVQLSWHPRQKGVPQRVILKVGARTDARLIVKRKFTGFLSNRPLTFFGPPVVEAHQPAAAELWVRSDEAALVERLFSDANLARSISENLVARFDEIKVDRRGLKITRAIDDRIVRTRYGIAFKLTFDASHYEPIAREELTLSEALVDRLSMQG